MYKYSYRIRELNEAEKSVKVVKNVHLRYSVLVYFCPIPLCEHRSLKMSVG